MRVKTDPPAGVDGGLGDGEDRRTVLEREIKLAVTPSPRPQAWARGTRSVAAAFTAGELAGLERAAAADARARWPAVWQAFSTRRGGWP
jgi:hypothetical protein